MVHNMVYFGTVWLDGNTRDENRNKIDILTL